MKPRKLKLGILSILLLIGSCFSIQAFSQDNIPLPKEKIQDCYGTLEVWVMNKKYGFEWVQKPFTIKNEKYTCFCSSPDGEPVCTPNSSQQSRPQHPRIESRQSNQELSDEQIVELIERTKALTAPVKAEDEARLQAESRAFQDRLILLMRDLKSLPDEPIPQFKVLKMKLQDLAEKATTVKEMANIARWSLRAAKTLDLEDAKKISGWGFDEWNRYMPAWDFPQLTVNVSVPEIQTYQFMAFKYIADWASDMYAKIIMLQQKRNEAEKKASELRKQRVDMFYQEGPVPLVSQYTEEQKKKKQMYDDLDKQAETLLKEANQMFEDSMKYYNEVSNMERELDKLVKDPSSCEAFIKKHSVKFEH